MPELRSESMSGSQYCLNVKTSQCFNKEIKSKTKRVEKHA